jgi:MerR family transcriptional regulator, aldehyde-responsive regulator
MRRAGLAIEALIEYIGLVQQGDRTVEARKEILKEQRVLLATKIHEMQETLVLLVYKIEIYDKAILKKEKELTETDI